MYALYIIKFIDFYLVIVKFIIIVALQIKQRLKNKNIFSIFILDLDK